MLKKTCNKENIRRTMNRITTAEINSSFKKIRSLLPNPHYLVLDFLEDDYMKLGITWYVRPEIIESLILQSSFEFEFAYINTYTTVLACRQLDFYFRISFSGSEVHVTGINSIGSNRKIIEYLEKAKSKFETKERLAKKAVKRKKKKIKIKRKAKQAKK